MAKFTRRVARPDDPIFTSGPQVFTPIARPRPDGTWPATSPGSPKPISGAKSSQPKRARVRKPRKEYVAGPVVNLELMCMTLEEYYEEMSGPELVESLRNAPPIKRGTVEQSLLEQLEKGELPAKKL